jgi:hypothetical protein
MGFSQARLFLLVSLVVAPLVSPSPVSSQSSDRIWGRITTTSGEVHEGFIRWDRNEASWADLLDGTKELSPMEFQDWWALIHPDDRGRDRVIEYGGYRITWDDNEPEFPTSVESGIRFGHIRRLTPVDQQEAELELRSGQLVTLTGGSTDLGTDLREILISDTRGRVEEFEWEDLERVEFFQAPAGSNAGAGRLHGTVEMLEGPTFTGYLAWDLDEILTTDTLDGEDSDGEDHRVLFGRIASIRPIDDGAALSLEDGSQLELFGDDDVDRGNDGIQVSDPGLGMVVLDWDDVEVVRFHSVADSPASALLDGGPRLKGTVATADSTEFSGWIRWDGDEEYSWELLDGRAPGVEFDVEFGQIAGIEKFFGESTAVNLGPAGVRVTHPVKEGAKVTLRDGRVFEMDGSNDVDESNHGIFILPDEGGLSPDDENAEWIWVRWEDFQSLKLEWGEGR